MISAVPGSAHARPLTGGAAPVAISFSDAVALSGSDAWAVGNGTDPNDPDNMTPRSSTGTARLGYPSHQQEQVPIEHWNGSRWTIVPAPAAFVIHGAAAAASEDVCAVGWNISHSVIE